MNRLVKHIKSGQVYRRADLEFYSTSIDRELAQLTQKGSLMKISQGLYYVPKKSKFGIVPPTDEQVVERFLKDDGFLIVTPNLYNSLGLGLTQLYNVTWVYNHKRKGVFSFNGRSYEFKLKSAFPQKITKEFLLIDLLNHLNELPEDQTSVLTRLPNKISGFNLTDLRKMSLLYGNGKTKTIIKKLIRKTFTHA